MAGMITAIAGLITALVGAAAFIYQLHGSPAADQQPAATPTTATASHTAQPAVRTSAPPAPPPATDTEPAGSGPYLLLFTNDGADLDADPPKQAAAPDIDIYDGDGSIVSYPTWPGLARWSQSKAPSRADCASLLNGFGVDHASFTKGSRFCVRTRDEKHFAYVEFVGPAEGGWKIRVTVWPGTAG
jgi:hypothetical protein